MPASCKAQLCYAIPLQRHYRDVLCSRVHTPQNDAVLQGVGKAVFAQRQKERT